MARVSSSLRRAWSTDPLVSFSSAYSATAIQALASLWDWARIRELRLSKTTISLLAGYYFKVVKKKKEQFIDEDDEEDEEEEVLEDEDETEDTEDDFFEKDDEEDE